MKDAGEAMSGQEDPAAELAAANAAAAQLAAEKARLELDEWKSPGAVANRAAQQRADTAQAEKSLTDSSLGQFAGAVPDLSKVNTGSTTVDAGTQLSARPWHCRPSGRPATTPPRTSRPESPTKASICS